MKAFRDVGYLSQKHIKGNIGLVEKRLLNFTRDGYVEKCGYLNQKTKETEHVYRLSDKGKKLASSQMNLWNFYKSSSAKHDLALAEKYFSLKEIEKESWKTEADLRNSLVEHIETLKFEGDIAHTYRLEEMLLEREISIPDASYTKEEGGQIIAVEVITNSYGTKEIQAKKNYIREMQIDYETIKI